MYIADPKEIEALKAKLIEHYKRVRNMAPQPYVYFPNTNEIFSFADAFKNTYEPSAFVFASRIKDVQEEFLKSHDIPFDSKANLDEVIASNGLAEEFAKKEEIYYEKLAETNLMRMPFVLLEATPEQYKEVYASAKRIFDLEPWRYFCGEDLIRYKLDRDSDYVYFDVLGHDKNTFGLVYYFDNGFNSIMTICHADRLNVDGRLAGTLQNCQCIYLDDVKSAPQDAVMLYKEYHGSIDVDKLPWFMRIERGLMAQNLLLRKDVDELLEAFDVLARFLERYGKVKHPERDPNRELAIQISQNRTTKEINYRSFDVNKVIFTPVAELPLRVAGQPKRLPVGEKWGFHIEYIAPFNEDALPNIAYGSYAFILVDVKRDRIIDMDLVNIKDDTIDGHIGEFFANAIKKYGIPEHITFLTGFDAYVIEASIPPQYGQHIISPSDKEYELMANIVRVFHEHLKKIDDTPKA